MATFQPPTDNFLALSNFDIDLPATPNNRSAYGLFRHYQNLPRGRNIYRLSDGTYIENDPYDTADVTRTYYGGHVYEINETEVAELTAAGYGAYIS